MNHWLSSLPKSLLAAGAIGIGILFIILSDPPHTICDAQLEILKSSQEGFLFKESKNNFSPTPDFEKLMLQCKTSNSPGGCYELFLKMKKLIGDIRNVPQECRPQISASGQMGKDVVRAALFETLNLLARVAWGEKPPRSLSEKYGWLDMADRALFCDLKTVVTERYGQGSWEQFREALFKELPGAPDLSRKNAWELMLLSTNCARYY